MDETYEQRIAIGYVLSIVRTARGRKQQVGSFIVDWVESHGPSLGIELPVSTGEKAGEWQRPGRRKAGNARITARVDEVEGARAALEARAKDLRRARPSATERSIREIACLLGLDPLETELFGALIRFCVFEPAYAINEWWQQLGREPRFTQSTQLLGWMLGAPRRDIAVRLAPEGRLVQSGLVRIGMDYDSELAPLHTLVKAFQTSTGKNENLLTIVLGVPSKATLGWEDFDHIADDRDHLLHVLEGALAQK